MFKFTRMTVDVSREPSDPHFPVGGLLGCTAALTVPVSGEELQELLSFNRRAVLPVAIEDFEPWPAGFLSAIRKAEETYGGDFILKRV